MNPDFDFKSQADKLLLAMQFLSTIDVDGIVEAISEAHTVGWFLDPTAYRDALSLGHMDAVGLLARELRAPIRIFRERLAPVGATA